MLAIPNAAEGHQQTAYMMAGDVIKGDIPVSTGPTWGMIESPGIGFEVDEKAVKKYHEAFLKDGPFIIYGDKFPVK
jgi:L-alanine-DL-glutamate epimerase-like enolase superfamily enzyme